MRKKQGLIQTNMRLQPTLTNKIRVISEAKMVVEVNKQLGGGFEEVLYVSYCVLLFETLTLILEFQYCFI